MSELKPEDVERYFAQLAELEKEFDKVDVEIRRFACLLSSTDFFLLPCGPERHLAGTCDTPSQVAPIRCAALLGQARCLLLRTMDGWPQ